MYRQAKVVIFLAKLFSFRGLNLEKNLMLLTNGALCDCFCRALVQHLEFDHPLYEGVICEIMPMLRMQPQIV